MKIINLFLGLMALAAPVLSQGGDTCSTAIPALSPGTYVLDLATATASGFSDIGSGNFGCLVAYPAFCNDRFLQFTAPVAGDYEIVPYSSDPFSQRAVLLSGVGCAATCEQVVQSPGVQLLGVQAGEQFLIQCGRERPSPFHPCETEPIFVEIDQCLGTRQDGYEGNDTCGSAAPIQDGTIQGLNVERMDRDYYSIDLPDTETLNASIAFQHSQANVELYLWDPSLGCGGLTDLARSVSTTNDESINYTNTTGATRSLVLEVNVNTLTAGSGDCASYDLTVSRMNPLGPIGGNYCQATPNAQGLQGYMLGYGSTSISLNSVVLTALNLPPNQFGLLAASDTQAFVPGLNGTSNGNLCLGGVLGRYPVVSTGTGGAVGASIDLLAVPQGGGVIPVAPGMTLNFQFWHRDPTGLGSNFTSGFSFVLTN